MTDLIHRRGALKLGLGLAATAPLLGALPVRAQVVGDIVDTAVAAGGFTTLVAAVQAAGLVDTLKSPGPFTVFAPTDDAFAKLPAGTVEGLLADIPALTNILTYHVAANTYPASALVGRRGRIPTVQGDRLRIDGTGGGVRVDGATVVTPDVRATNGIIHVIDTVLIPH